MLNENKGVASFATKVLKILWQEGFFNSWRNLKTISTALGKRGNHFSSAELGTALLRANYLTRRGKRRSFEYIQKREHMSKGAGDIEQNLFADDLVKKLEKDFSVELTDLRLSFGRSGNCSAFLLRKILEKLIYITFARNGLESKLKDKSCVGKLVGLESMINIASSEKIDGAPFIIPKTAREIGGIKFLGDASAHNPLTDVDMQTIIPQMPFIITAYKELVSHL